MTANGIVGILLAAGSGTRFGGDKLLHPLADGTPMAVAAARTLRRACAHCVSVLRPDQETLAALLAGEGVAVRFDPEARQGMGRSLAAAVRSAPEAAGWLVALADMPFIAPATCRAVAAALRDGAGLAAPFLGERRGHPVGFSRPWFEALSALQGDLGARGLLADQPAALVRVPCDDPGILIDIDTPAALDSPRRRPGNPVPAPVR
jgi:molybdenum cofactor cytidylyltransferase